LKAWFKRARAQRKLIDLVLDRRAGRPGSEQALERHLAQVPDARPMAQQLDRLWDEIGRVTPPALRMGEPPEKVVPFRPRRRWIMPVALAASLAAVLLARPPAAPHATHAAASTAQAFTAGAQTRVLRLADGSHVTLAPGARVEIALSPARRALRLTRGEAWFAVVHDAQRPFTVSTPFGTATDIGTAFDVRLEPRATLITVAEGTVRVAAQGAWRDVIHDQQVPLRPGLGIGPVTAVDGRAAGGWTSGWLHFEGTPLAQVVDEVNRHAARHLVLADSTRAGVPIYAIIKVGEIDGLLALAAAQPAIGPHALAASTP
jgi:transmembrane sensor